MGVSDAHMFISASIVTCHVMGHGLWVSSRLGAMYDMNSRVYVLFVKGTALMGRVFRVSP